MNAAYINSIDDFLFSILFGVKKFVKHQLCMIQIAVIAIIHLSSIRFKSIHRSWKIFNKHKLYLVVFVTMHHFNLFIWFVMQATYMAQATSGISFNAKFEKFLWAGLSVQFHSIVCVFVLWPCDSNDRHVRCFNPFPWPKLVQNLWFFLPSIRQIHIVSHEALDFFFFFSFTIFHCFR